MFDDVPVAVLGSVLKYIDNAGDEFVDNIRIAEHGNKKSERLYEEKKRCGCCGFVDYIYVPFDIRGKKYYFGYNHGH